MNRRFDSYNAGYAREMYERYVRNPDSVDEAWRRLFDAGEVPGGDGATAAATAAAAVPTGRSAVDPEELRAARATGEVIDAYRLHGHYAARLDPLGGDPTGHPMLDPAFHGVDATELEGTAAAPLREVIDWLRRTYSASVGYEYEHLQIPERREWLRERIESGTYLTLQSADERRWLLKRLTEVEAFEQFLHRAYLGQKRFSVEGNDMLVPMLDAAIERAAEAGAREAVLGMAHRGRLNVLVHVVGRSYQAILSEFEGRHTGFGTTGDVKYHLGAEGTFDTPSGPVLVTLAPNPSHLEFVDPVVEGMARAKQTDRTSRELRTDESSVLPVLIHGDAAFAGQGVVAETLNLAELPGYRTGGTLHIIVNNQIGFTTDPREGRSTDYASDMARGFDVPIFHINADDPEACLGVMRLALDYRTRFHADVLIDLVGYRRYGHNEGDEPAYTQPRLYSAIAGHPTVRKLLAARLVDEGVVDQATVDAMLEKAHARLVAAQDAARAQPEAAFKERRPEGEDESDDANGDETGVAGARLKELNRKLHSWPDAFTVNPKLARQLERRAQGPEQDGPVDWAHAESLALAAVLTERVPVRLTGQDTERGTFSQRHLVLHDYETGDEHIPLAHLDERQAPIEIYNSPLSEVATVGFEYGYSTAAPEALVLWEAQFGDFVNVAQVVIDQFIASGYAKWGQRTRLGLLLPHGYEGQGPEHSSARLERFLQLAAENNLFVVNATTPAQYFHVLRRQARSAAARPLVVMTPKSLLRHPRAVSPLAELAQGRFLPVLDDADAAGRREGVTRLVLCTGKVYYDLTGSDDRSAASHVAVARIEQLYPLDEPAIGALVNGYPSLEEVVWAQEEPQNMGAWRFMAERLRALLPDGMPLRYVGRPERASPAEGYLTRHEPQQARIVAEAFAPTPELPRRKSRRA